MEEIVVIREYDDLPYIVKSEDGQIEQPAKQTHSDARKVQRPER